MAAILVPAITGNKCVGSYTDGSVLRKHFCEKGTDANGDSIYTCATWRDSELIAQKLIFNAVRCRKLGWLLLLFVAKDSSKSSKFC